MKAFTEYLTLNIPSKMAFVNITPQVQEAVRKSGVTEGLVLVKTMHYWDASGRAGPRG
jgi:thiamine phosphate synthase YjbQ (UPF0047 family)